MQTKSFRIVGGTSLIVGSILLFAYSALFPLVLPLEKAATEYAALVNSPWWNPLAASAFAGVLGTMLGFLAVYGRFAEKAGTFGVVGFLAFEFAQLLQACKVTWEFCIYPVLAKHPASLFLLNDRVLRTDPLVANFRILAMLSILIGIVTFCVAIIRSKAFPAAAGYSVLAGALIYGVGPMLSTYVAVGGIALYAIGCLWLGFHLLRPTESS